MSVMTLGDFQSATFPNFVSNWVYIGRDMQPNMIPSMFNTSSSTQAVEVDTVYNGLDLMSQVTEGGVAPPDEFGEQESKYYTSQEYRKSFVVTRKLLDDGKGFDVAAKGSSEMGKSYVETQNIMAFSVVNNAFSAEKSVDGAAIISTSHLSRSGTTSNRLSTNAALSEASAEQINIEVKKAKNDRGIRMNMRMRKLHVPVDLDAAACRLLENSDRPATSDRDINYTNRHGIFEQGYSSNIYLTDTAAWYVTTTEADNNCLKFYNRVNLEMKSTVDDETDNVIYRSYARWGQGCTNHMGLWGSQGL